MVIKQHYMKQNDGYIVTKVTSWYKNCNKEHRCLHHIQYIITQIYCSISGNLLSLE